MAHGFLSSKGNLVLEDVGNEVWNELYLRSFFQEIKVNSGNAYFKMHDLIHDLATSLFSASASSSNIHEINAKSYTHKMSIGFAEVVSSYSPSLLKRCVSLRVLNLSKSKLDQLPSSIGDLLHLRYLDLSHNIFRSLPENLCKLQNLQTLNLRYCVLLSCLPKQTSKHSISYFRNLKGLLKKVGEEQFPVLEEIKIYRCPMFVFPTLSSVKKLVIHKEADATGFRSISNLTTLTSLYMYTNYEATSLPEGMFKSLANLKYLKISYYYNLKELPSSLTSLNALEHLGIDCCGALECLSEEGLEGLTSLRELSLQKCKILKCLPEGLQHLTALTTLIISQCPIVFKRCEKGIGEDWHKITHNPSVNIYN